MSGQPRRKLDAPGTASAEVARILALPRRPASIPPGVAERLTAELRTPTGTLRFWPEQAWALDEARTARGLVAMIPVGGGKSLLSAVIPTVVGAKRAVLLVPAKLKRRFLEKDYGDFSKHFRLLALDSELHVASHDDISSKKRGDLLEQLEPDCIVIDECHTFRATVTAGERSARTSRLVRYFQDVERAGKPLPGLYGMSGTIFRKSLRDAAYLTWFALKERSPLPLDWALIDEWSLAVDPLPPHEEWRRPRKTSIARLFVSPGVSGEPAVSGSAASTVETLRQAVYCRVVETHGIISVSAARLGASLNLHQREIKVPAKVKSALATLRTTWVSPDGREIDDALEFSRLIRQVALGFYYVRTWPADTSREVQTEYLAAESAWNREVRRFLSTKATRGMDSPGLLEDAARCGAWQSATYGRWAAVKCLTKPGQDTKWVDTYLIEDALEWARNNVGLVWYKHRAFEEKLRELIGAAGMDMPVYGEGESDGIDAENEDGTRSIAVSIGAQGTGWRLHRYSRNLITYVSSSADTWQQLLGRTHRPGQEADSVEAHVYLPVPECRKAFSAATNEARFSQGISGNEQKLLLVTPSFY